VRENGGGLMAGSALAAAEKAAAAARTSNEAVDAGCARRDEEETIDFEMIIFLTCGVRGEVKLSAGGDSGGAKMELFFLAEDLAGLDGCRENVRKDIVSGQIIINWEWHAA
jgi:hypothetical protein